MSALRGVRNLRNGELFARVSSASNPWTRLVGLLGRERIRSDEGLWIEGCSAVHTLGMRATLDLFFLDRSGVVLGIERRVPPNRPAVGCKGAKTVLELGAACASRDVAVGDRLALE